MLVWLDFFIWVLCIPHSDHDLSLPVKPRASSMLYLVIVHHNQVPQLHHNRNRYFINNLAHTNNLIFRYDCAITTTVIQKGIVNTVRPNVRKFQCTTRLSKAISFCNAVYPKGPATGWMAKKTY